MRVAVQVFSFAEPDLKRTLDAYANCRTPAGAEFLYKVYVTPREAVTAYSVGAARDHDVFELVETPPGKLTSRDVAHDRAVDTGADVIVTGDADAPPLEEGYLETLLAPFEHPEVVATNSLPVAPGLIGLGIDAIGALEDVVRPHLHGQGSAFTATTWERAGGFDEAIDQRDAGAVRRAEEFGLYRRFAALGKVVNTGARVRNDSRRVRCALRSVGAREPTDPFCQRRGVATFEPRHQR